VKPITVVGAGFSGLVTAYLLKKSGREVRVVEKKSRAGGLIHTIRTEHGLVETAANGILNSARVETMCADIGVPLLHMKRDARKRFIFRNKPRQLPLNPIEALRVAAGVALNATRMRPKSFETIAEWGRRVVGKGATDYLLVPALGGIYAGDPERLSASLIFGSAGLAPHLQTQPPAKAKLRGTVAPPNGMQQLIDGLSDYLQSKGVEINFETEREPDPAEPTVVCLSASAAAEYLAGLAPNVASELDSIEMLSLLTVTCFFDSSAASVGGFGCLFPRNQGFRSRGVLFNTSIFEGRGFAPAETWIFGGAFDGDIVELTDDQIRETLLIDRERFYGRADTPLATYITRWPNALPHYSVDLERTLVRLAAPPPNVALVGNYLGKIGLAKILERAAYVVENVARDWNWSC